MAGMSRLNLQPSLMTTQSHARREADAGEVRFHALAANFLFAFDQELQPHRQAAMHVQPGLGALDVREHLPLVVGRAAGEEIAVAAGRLKGRTDP